jgi:hypothetical protein
MSATRIKKPLMVSAILIFFTFGAFAMSLAYESSSDGPLFTAFPRRASGDGLLRSDPLAQQFTLLCLSGDVPRTTQPNFQQHRISHFRVVARISSSIFLKNHVPKVSLQILQSVLLI